MECQRFEHTQKKKKKTPAIFVHNPSLYVPHCCCRTTQPLQIHTHFQTCYYYVSELCAFYVCILSPAQHGNEVHSPLPLSHILSFCYHYSYRGSLSRAPSLSHCFSQLAPPHALLQHLLPSPLTFASSIAQRASEG